MSISWPMPMRLWTVRPCWSLVVDVRRVSVEPASVLDCGDRLLQAAHLALLTEVGSRCRRGSAMSITSRWAARWVGAQVVDRPVGDGTGAARPLQRPAALGGVWDVACTSSKRTLGRAVASERVGVSCWGYLVAVDEPQSYCRAQSDALLRRPVRRSRMFRGRLVTWVGP